MTVRAYVSDAWRQRLETAGLGDLAQLLQPEFTPTTLGGRWTALTKPGLGGRERWRWTLDDGDGAKTVYLKRYFHTPWKAQVDRFWRQCGWRSRGWWEFHQSETLAAKYIPAPGAVAAVEHTVGPTERASAVLLEEAPGDGLDRVLARLTASNAAILRAPARQDLIRRLGRFVSAFHNTGFCHRDLYLCHIFAEIDGAGASPPQFRLIDLARTFRPRWRRMRWILKDLSQLDYSSRQIGASRADRLRFLEAYLSLFRDSPRARWYARKVRRRSDRILSREKRKGRA